MLDDSFYMLLSAVDDDYLNQSIHLGLRSQQSI